MGGGKGKRLRKCKADFGQLALAESKSAGRSLRSGRDSRRKIVSVQINDVYERPYAASILRDESMHDRLAPGTGCGDTAAFCRMLKEKGIEPKAMGVEVISDAILAKGVAAAAKFNFDNTVKVLQEGWPEAMPEK